MTEIQDIEGVQKDVLLKRTKIKKTKKTMKNLESVVIAILWKYKKKFRFSDNQGQTVAFIVKYFTGFCSFKTTYAVSYVKLGGGVGDVPFWCLDGAYVEFGFR